MVRPDDYLPPGARTQVPVPTRRQRLLRRADPLLATLFFSAGVAVWTVAVAGRGAAPQWGMFCGAFVTLGLFGAVKPAWGFAFGERWTYREDPQPSRAYLVLTRAGGVVMLVLGLGLGLLTDGPSYGDDPTDPGVVVEDSDGSVLDGSDPGTTP